MKNRFKERNFSVYNDNTTPIREDLDYSFSNFLYDQNKGVTHDFVHTNKGNPDDFCRLVGDIEICMSNDELIRSNYPPEYREKLKAAINGMGTLSKPSGLTDDQILESGIRCHESYELDESAVVVSRLSDTLQSIVDQNTVPDQKSVPDARSVPDPTPSSDNPDNTVSS